MSKEHGEEVWKTAKAFTQHMFRDAHITDLLWYVTIGPFVLVCMLLEWLVEGFLFVVGGVLSTFGEIVFICAVYPPAGCGLFVIIAAFIGVIFLMIKVLS